jgi:hypothetical protein
MRREGNFVNGGNKKKISKRKQRWQIEKMKYILVNKEKSQSERAKIFFYFCTPKNFSKFYNSILHISTIA